MDGIKDANKGPGFILPAKENRLTFAIGANLNPGSRRLGAKFRPSSLYAVRIGSGGD